MRKGLIICLILAMIVGNALAQAKPSIPEIDRIRIAEASRG